MSCTRTWRDPHRTRPLPPAGVRLLAGTPAARARLPRAGRPGGHRGHVRRPAAAPPSTSSRRRRAPCSSCSATPTWPPPPTPLPALLPFEPIALEGLDARMVDVVSGERRCRARTAGRARLAVRRTGRRPDRSRGRRDRRRRRAGAAAWSPTPAEAAALWRIREDGAGLAARAVGGQGAHAGWEDAAVPPRAARRLPARVRGRCWPTTGLTGTPVRPLRRRLRAHPDHVPAARGRRCRRVPRVPHRRGRARRPLRRFAVRRTRRRPGPQRAAAADVLAGRAGRVRRREGRVRPGRRAQPRRAGPPRPVDATCGSRPPAAAAAGSAFALRRRRRRLHQRRAPLHRRRPSAARTTPRPVA